MLKSGTYHRCGHQSSHGSSMCSSRTIPLPCFHSCTVCHGHNQGSRPSKDKARGPGYRREWPLEPARTRPSQIVGASISHSSIPPWVHIGRVVEVRRRSPYLALCASCTAPPPLVDPASYKPLLLLPVCRTLISDSTCPLLQSLVRKSDHISAKLLSCLEIIIY